MHRGGRSRRTPFLPGPVSRGHYHSTFDPFGVLFVVSGYNLWTVMLCHGLYDTIAFVRFANKKSKYSDLETQSW